LFTFPGVKFIHFAENSLFALFFKKRGHLQAFYAIDGKLIPSSQDLWESANPQGYQSKAEKIKRLNKARSESQQTQSNEIVPGLVESGGSRLSARYATCTC